MKKYLISAAIVAAVGISAYLGFRPATESELSDIQLANAEALSTGEIIIEYAKNCLSERDDICVKGPTWVIYKSEPYDPSNP